MQVVACQLDIAWEDKPTNYGKVTSLLDGVNIGPGALIVLPEMFATGFSMNVDVTDEAADHHSGEAFAQLLADEFNACVIAGVVNRAPSGKGFNEAVVFDARRELCRYRKVQPFSIGGEHEHYEAGDAPMVFEWGGAKVSPFVCYDLRFPEHFRTAAAMGAEVIAVIANWPVKRIEHWRVLLRARAIENQAFVIGVNRCGVDPSLAYTGQSMIVDPMGRVLADAGDGEGVITATLDLADQREFRERFPVLKDMRAAASVGA